MVDGLSTVLEARTSDGSTMNGSVNTSNSEQGPEYTGQTLTGQKTSGDREHVHVEGRWAPLHPKMIEDRSKTHSDGEESLGDNESLYRVMNDQLPVLSEQLTQMSLRDRQRSNWEHMTNTSWVARGA